MNEHLPYEDELMKRLNDLQLPNEDAAWEDMKRRLDKDDEDKPIIPLVFKGCGGYAILLLLVAIVLLLIVDPARWFHGSTKKPHITTDSVEYRKLANKNGKYNHEPVPGNDTAHEILLKDNTALSKKGITHSTLMNDSSVDKNEILKRGSSNSRTNKIQNGYINITKQDAKTFNRQNNNVSTKKIHQYNHPAKKIKGALKSTVANNTGADSVINDNKNTEHTKTYQPDKTKNDTANIVIKAKIDLDSMKKKKVHITTHDNKAETDSLKQKNIYFGAGLAIHQLLPVAGQKSNPYNSLGRKSSLGDYIPSVYVRLYKDKKWFIQSEFRYGAPQYSKEIVYIPKKIIDTSASSITSESKRLKKTFYHQLPVSFNYFILPGLSIGTGITFNKFSTALVQQDVHKTGIITQTDTLVSSGLVSQKKPDSNFIKSYLQALFETQYQWKRLSVGVRYSFGLQPYLKFTLPGGLQRQERNSSLQLFIRYELWHSRKRNE